MPNPNVGLGAAWAGCVVEPGYVRNFSSTAAHTNGGMANFEMYVRCNGNDNSGAFTIPSCIEKVSLPYSCVSLDPMTTNPAGETTQDLTKYATGKYCWGGSTDKRAWSDGSGLYSSYDECKQKCGQSFYNTISRGIDEESFDLLFPGYLG